MEAPRVDPAPFPGFGRVVNGCDPSLLDATYVEMNRRAGVGLMATTVSIKEDFATTKAAIDSVRRLSEQTGARILTTRQDLSEAHDLAIVLAMQNTSACEESLERLDDLIELGVRIVQLTYNERNAVGSGCTEPNDEGLTTFGKSVVKHLQDRGVVIDLSHVGRATVADTIGMAQGPVTFTHANCNSLCPNPRNRTDEEIKWAADSGGIVGLNAFPFFVDAQKPDVNRLAEHAAHIAGMTSSAHVTLGLDFIYGRDLNWVKSLGYQAAAYPSLDDWPSSYAEGIEDVSGLGNLADALRRVGFSDREIEAIFCDNLTKVLTRVWASN